MIILQVLLFPYYFIYPRVIMLYALSKGLKAMSEANKRDNNHDAEGH